MSFYDLNKEERNERAAQIHADIQADLKAKTQDSILLFYSDEDTYIRKAAYLATGKIYKQHSELRKQILTQLQEVFLSGNEKIRQTTINAAGEIGIIDFGPIESLMEQGLNDVHHSVRNAVIGSVKKMGEKNALPVLAFARKYLLHPDFEIRREICHGLELRGRTHPQDILPMLRLLQFDKKPRVRNTLIHVIGQIAYKKGCLETVISDLNTWENKELVKESIAEIIDVHQRYANFSFYTQTQAIAYIEKNSVIK